MSKDMEEYLKNLSSEYINMTLDLNNYIKLVSDIEKLLKSRVKAENKITKIKDLIEDFNENLK